MGNLETIPLHVTPELVDLRNLGSFNGQKPTWSPTWHAMHNVPSSVKFSQAHHLKEVGLTQNWEIMTLQNFITLALF